MKNKDNTRSDLEGGMPVKVVTVAPKVPLRISRSFNLTKATTQQKALLLLCVAGTILDPLFFYIPMINEGSKCMKSDQKLGIIAITLRSLVDVLHIVQWSLYYKKKWKTRGSTAATVASKEISQGNPNSLSPRNSKETGFAMEIVCILPFPQAATLAILIIKGNPRSQRVVTLLKFSVLIQFILRALRVFPSFHEATTNSFTLLKSRFWIGAGFNLLLFMIASHVLGAFWYLLSVGRTMDCWKSACRSRVDCNIDSLYCGGPMDNKSYLDDYCTIQQATNSSAFDFGIYLSALESNIVGSIRFSLKFSYCFWWGLRNLSSLGQNLTTSAYEWEICFSICISILGLILFSLFIGNMQAYFQYRTNQDLTNMNSKMDKIMNKQRELWNWPPFRWLPQNLKQDVLLYIEDNWIDTPEVDLQSMLDNLPKDLGARIKVKIFSKLMMNFKVKLFQALNDDGLLESTIDRVKPKVYAEGSHVFQKDEPIDKMVFIVNVQPKKQIGTDGSMLRVWDFFGQELLNHTLNSSSTTQSSSIMPLSTSDIKTCTKVEAFIIDIKDLEDLVKKYKDTIIEEPKTLMADAKTSKKRKARVTYRLNEVGQLQRKQHRMWYTLG